LYGKQSVLAEGDLGHAIATPYEAATSLVAGVGFDRLFFNAYTFEQVETFVKANPSRWMANPYSGDGRAVTLEHDLQRLHATRAAIGYLAYGARVDGPLPRIEGTSYFYRDGSELTDEHETFHELTRR